MSSPPGRDVPDGVDERAWLLGEMLAAYTLLMDTVGPESRYYQGERGDPDRELYLGDIMERAAARRRELKRDEDTDGW